MVLNDLYFNNRNLAMNTENYKEGWSATKLINVLLINFFSVFLCELRVQSKI